ncbi:MAG TPA: NAD(P)H-dependent oxidoreductase [Flavipsychrobacter sp.]|nr:NAD(P)H-dependent oxidoreductase [Flavipsychrobacter sp.]
MYKLKIINSTVRPGRKAPHVVKWIERLANTHSAFDVEVLDLAIINLPLMDEPNHPGLQKYQHEHTKKWSAKIEEADAYIFVTAEYNFNYPAPLRNALEYLFKEWNYKAAGIVSYGGVSAGTRAANGLRGDLTVYKIVPINEMVNIPFFSKLINDKDEFVPTEQSEKAAHAMLNEIARWTKGLMTIRQSM